MTEEIYLEYEHYKKKKIVTKPFLKQWEWDWIRAYPWNQLIYILNVVLSFNWVTTGCVKT
jgi:hypothetical protein